MDEILQRDGSEAGTEAHKDAEQEHLDVLVEMDGLGMFSFEFQVSGFKVLRVANLHILCNKEMFLAFFC
jgi:hypothetical protein